MLRRIGRRFLHEIDSETTELYQWMLYLVWGGGGLLYIVSDAGPPVSLQESMTWLSYVLWSWMNVVGPASCLLGKVLPLWRSRLTYAGLLFYLTGNLLTCVAAFSFIVGAYQTWGKAAWGPVPTLVICIATAGLTVRAFRRLLEVEVEIGKRRRR